MIPSVSVVLPVRNAVRTLGDALQSIASQTLDEFEALIVDDHSTDGSRELAENVAAADPRFRVLANPASGIVAALNAGLAAARGDLIARMDADDLMLPARLAAQRRFLRHNPGVTLVACRVEQFPAVNDGAREYLRWQNGCTHPDHIAEEIYVESPFAHPSVTFRRGAVLAAGGYRHGDFPEDYELWLRLHRCGAIMQKLPEVLLRWRDSPRRLSRSSPRYRREAFDELRSVYLCSDPRFRRRATDFAVWGAGRRTRRRCAHLLAKGFRPTAWIDIDPKKIGNRLEGVPVVPPDWLEGRRVFVLGYVASHGARDDMTGWLRALGYRGGRDYLMVG